MKHITKVPVILFIALIALIGIWMSPPFQPSGLMYEEPKPPAIINCAICGVDVPEGESPLQAPVKAQASSPLFCKRSLCYLYQTLYRASSYCYLANWKLRMVQYTPFYPMYWYCWNQIVWGRGSNIWPAQYGFVYRSHYY